LIIGRMVRDETPRTRRFERRSITDPSGYLAWG
jgi:hypothetical protein